MSHEIEHNAGGGGILANKLFWICVGAGIFLLIGFILPTPQSIIEIVEKYGFAERMIEWEVAHDTEGAANKTMIVLGIIPMAVIFFSRIVFNPASPATTRCKDENIICSSGISLYSSSVGGKIFNRIWPRRKASSFEYTIFAPTARYSSSENPAPAEPS